MMKRTLIASAVSLTMLTACGDSAVVQDPNANQNPNPNTDNGNGPENQAGERRLKQLETNDAFFSALKTGLIRQNSLSGYGSEVLESSVDSDAIVMNSPIAPNASSSDAASSGSDQASSNNAVNDVTTTNVQEIGVDEQDRMKSDGEFLYVLDTQYNYVMPEPIDPGLIDPVFMPEPTDPDIGVPSITLSTGLPPQGTDADQLVDSVTVADIASSSMMAPTSIDVNVRILSLQPESPDATAITDLKIDLGGGAADGMYLYKSDNKRNLILTASTFNNYYANWNDSSAFSRARSVVTKLDVSDPTQSAIQQTIQIDGQIISSRRIDNRLFVASRYYPNIPGVDPYSISEEDYKNALDNVDLKDVLPKITQGADGDTTDLVNPAECFVASAPNSDLAYYSPDIVSLSVIDLDTLQLQDSECFLGSTETLYATPNSVFLATTRWDYSASNAVDPEDSVAMLGFVDPRIDTDIHQFSIDGAELSYSGSGVVTGHLGWNPNRKPFRMSEKDGYLRVATMSDQFIETVSPINVSVLKLEGDGELTTVAQLPNDNNPEHIGKPGESLYASRYLGDRGYFVTFRQTDPLYVIDFSNPEDPKLAGELEIDGYSDYLQPIGQDYLLGIGKDSIAQPDAFGGLDQGVKLSLFNVSDASNPTEVQSLVIGERGSESPALQNHRAITIQPATDTRPTRVVFGISVAGATNEQGDVFDWGNPWLYTGLHGFEIKTGADAGIENTGVMKVSTATNASPYDSRYGDDRSVIVGNSVYYIHGSDVYAADWSDLSNFSGPR